MQGPEHLTRVEERVLAASHALLNGSGKLSYFRQRGIYREVIEQAKVGYWRGAFTYPTRAKNNKLLAIHCKSETRKADGKRPQWWEGYSDELPLKGHGKKPQATAKVIPFGLETLADLEPGSQAVLCCGEEDALSLRQAGYTAVSQPGAGLLELTYARDFADLNVVVFYDAGEEHEACKDARKLERAGAQSVRVAEWPSDAPNGADINDRLVEDLEGFEEWIAGVIAAARPLTGVVRETKDRNGVPDSYASGQKIGMTGPTGRLLSQVEPEQVEWLWPGRIPLGKLTIVDGDPGTGKSALTTDLAGRVSVGKPLPDGTPCEVGGIVLLNAEDGLADTIRPRLEAAGANLDRVLALATVPDGSGFERLLSIPEDLDLIRRGIERVDARLVVIDPMMAFISKSINSHKDQDVRRALAPLAKLAEQTGAAIVVIRHLNQTTGQNALYRGGGSIGIIGAARSALLVAEHPEDEEQGVLAPLKSNLAKPAPSLAFVVTEVEGGAVKVEYKGETPLGANALLAAPADDEERRELICLRDAVLRLLRENGGSWQSEPTELYDLLAERDLTTLPDRPDELTKQLKKIARTGSTFHVSSDRKRNGNKVVRVLELSLYDQQALESPNGVNGVHGGNGVHRAEGSEQTVNTVNTVYTDTRSRDGARSIDVRSCLVGEVRQRTDDASKCIHEFPGGKGCYLCDPEHTYRER